MCRVSLLLLVYLATQLFALEWSNRDTLLTTHIIFRHGDRTPAFTLDVPNNPHVNETYFPYGLGQLTLNGKRRAYNLGAKLRKRYSEFLGPLYHMDLIEAISSPAPRCVMTMQAVLAALFPPTCKTQIKLGLEWQPVYFQAPSFDEDKLLYPTCEKIWDVDFQMDEETVAFYNYVGENLGVNVTGPYNMLQIQNNYRVLEEMGYELPEWVLSVWPEPFMRHGLKIWKLVADQTTPLAIGNLLKKINEDTHQVIDGTKSLKDRKIFMYSGHDLNVVAYLAAIGLYQENYYVEYSASLMIEIHNIDGNYGVKVFFDNSDGKEPELLKIPACDYQEMCPLQTYINITSAMYGPENWCT